MLDNLGSFSDRAVTSVWVRGSQDWMIHIQPGVRRQSFMVAVCATVLLKISLGMADPPLLSCTV